MLSVQPPTLITGKQTCHANSSFPLQISEHYMTDKTLKVEVLGQTEHNVKTSYHTTNIITVVSPTTTAHLPASLNQTTENHRLLPVYFTAIKSVILYSNACQNYSEVDSSLLHLQERMKKSTSHRTCNASEKRLHS